MKKVLLSLMAMLLLAVSVNARPVDVGKARQVAETWMTSMGMKNVSALQNVTAQTPFTEFYVFAAAEGGFILVSADDCVMPVLGYSLTTKFDAKGEIPVNVRSWLDDYENQIRYWKQQEARRNGLSTPPSATADQWQMLANGEMPPAPLTTAVAPMLSTTWDQYPYYNAMCPYDASEEYTGNNRVVTGCVATATAQIMKYHNYPTTGYGSHSYNHGVYGAQSANFGATTYQWSNMPNELTATSSTTQVNAVATLIYHIGVADNMDYGLAVNGGSSAQNYNVNELRASSQTALMKYFKYSPDMRVICRDDYTHDAYCNILRGELDQQRPILYSGHGHGGHSFVCEGYNNQDQFYINWGWSGYYDGYFTVDVFTPGGGGAGSSSNHDYSYSNVAIINIRPNTNWNTSATTTVALSSTGGDAGCGVTGAGSYAFGDTITMEAYTSDGYRFAGWTDNDHCNSRELIATGGSYNFTATFEPLQGDTLSYCTANSHNFTRYGFETWGIKLPASVLTSGHNLTSAMLYVKETGTYTLNIYLGNNYTTPVASSQTVYIDSTGVDQWHTFPLLNNVTIDGTQDVIISFNCPDADYPATVTHWCGNNNSFLGTENFYPYTNRCTFMIRGIFALDVVTDGDTVSYCGNREYVSSYGTGGGDLEWGIMFPADALTGNYLKSAMVYVADGQPGTYILKLYRGGSSAPATLAHSQSVTFTTTQTGWQEVMLDTIFALNNSQNLWITFATSGIGYPMSVCNHTGAANSDWVYLNDQWNHFVNYGFDFSWMIKAVTSATIPTPTVYYTVTALSADTTMGIVTGGGQYEEGTTATLTATSNTGYHFVQWQDGNSDNPRTVTVTANVTYTASFEADAPLGDTCSIVTFPYTMNFENGAPCWTVRDNNGSGATWSLIQDYGYGSSNCAYVMYEDQADDWLMSPRVVVPGDYTVSWKTRVMQSNFPETYQVWAMGTDTNIMIFSETFSDTTYVDRQATLTVPAGDSVLVMWRYLSADKYILFLDNIVISQGVIQYTLTVNSNDATMGSVTGSGTYNAGATATLTATPNTGYRFVQWQDGNTDNPRTVAVTANATYTATFASNAACVVNSYPYNLSFDSLDATKFSCWNIIDNDGDGYSWMTNSFPGYIASASYMNGVGALTPDNWFVSPQFQLATGNNYMLSWRVAGTDSTYFAEHYGVYVSTTGTAVSDFTLLQQYTLASRAETSVSIDLSAYAGQNIHVAFRHWNCTDQYWLLLDSITVTETSTPVQSYTITAVSADTTMGSVTGGGTYIAGTTTTLTATPNAGYHFVQWQDGNSDNPRTITVTANATYTATFEVNAPVDDSCTVTTLPWDYNFVLEGIGPCWTNIDADGDGRSWLYALNYGAASFSYDEGVSLTPDNWLISPKIAIPAAGANFHYTYVNIHPNYPDHIGVFVSTTNTAPSSFTLLEEYTATAADTSWHTRTVSLAAYAGQQVYIAIRHWNSDDQYIFVVGGVSVTVGSAPPQYTVTVLSADTTMGTVSGGGTYNAGATVTLTATPNSGYVFSQWQDGSTDNPRTIGVTANATFIAFFEEFNPCVVDVPYSNNFNSVDSVDCWVVYDPDQDATSEGLNRWLLFTGVGVDGTSAFGIANTNYTNYQGDYLVSPNITGAGDYVVTYKVRTYSPATLNYEIYALGVDTVGVYDSIADTNFTLRTYNFTLGEGDTTRIVFNYLTIGRSYLFIDDFSIEVQSTPLPPTQYTVTALSNNDAWGTVTGGGTYDSAATVTLEALPASGYRFAHWNDGITTNPRSVTVTSNITYVATFELIPATQYTVTVLSADTTMGTVSGGGTYGEGDNAIITATANEGYHFTQWNDGNTQSMRSVTVTADITYIANFEANAANQYTLTVVSNNPAWGTVTGGGAYTAGSTALLTATANEGYHFVEWSDGDTNATRTVTVTGDASYIATFAVTIHQYTLTVLSANETMGTVTGGGTYNEGSIVTITARPNAGYLFSQWSDGDTNASRTITVTEDATFVATFEVDVAIDDVSTYQRINVYPNPATDHVTLTGIAVGSRVTLIDAAGRQQGTWTVTGEQMTLDVSRLASGQYFLRISGADVNTVKKLIVE